MFNDKMRLINETVFIDTIKKTSMCLKKSNDILENLKDGVTNNEYYNALYILDKTCKILENLSEMNFKEAKLYTKLMLHKSGNEEIENKVEDDNIKQFSKE
ncbi:hypothetical protein [Clostridium autoethanogenum]|uniref:Uncharacterized protein n=2 Tax=Clostridium autoethanogenum TaxID=84023 RepID=A0A3M0SC19_9CLOT|nr:hypothetical protein [Clostridium autoethanogenum]AGY77960.1 hypothetical protein CAETHG_3759 [Clostridium autoethanogenum DSM 10061]ALU38094.1 Hypothetical protein CLAU_3667 [Clostridium autoethanogenum DSM 10061]OVY50858.1 hypothetical protein WX72_02019 [Clostridium autoethanogenum]RMC95184.1 hypothetical protein D9O40_16730 [Clostridium autoethanogenum]